MRLSVLSLVLVASVAHANGNDRVPPGLERVCDEIQPEVTASEVMISAIEAASYPPPCDLLAERGTCLGGGAKLAVTPDVGFGVVPVEAAPSELGEPVWVATAWDLKGTGGAATVAIDGVVVAEGLITDGPLEIVSTVFPVGTLARLPVEQISVGGEVVLERLLPFPDQDAASPDDVRLVSGEGGFEVQALASGGPYVTITATIDVTYQNAGQ